MVKVLGACPVNGHHWVFAAGMSDVEVELTVTTGSRAYHSPRKTAFQPIQHIFASPRSP